MNIVKILKRLFQLKALSSKKNMGQHVKHHVSVLSYALKTIGDKGITTDQFRVESLGNCLTLLLL